jgi:hypothetical protein
MTLLHLCSDDSVFFALFRAFDYFVQSGYRVLS